MHRSTIAPPALLAPRCLLALLFVLVCFVLPPREANAMSILDAGKSCVFSAVKGTLLLNGQPAAGAVVKRQVEYQSKDSDEATADASGQFEMPALYQRSVVKFLPAEFVAAQSLVVEYQGKEYKIWSNTKRKPDENAELGGKPLHLTCELSADLQLHREFGSILRTSCTW